ncbi:hypothetical protein [Pseudescherichia sp.]|uniref:hypothetical protein n=1 Tax=Pseudescherichia sp. TaxID=2055881 RepID=UPI002896BABE|nr:hypothetical protein [Pseudescherichia sp.]
MSSKSGFDPFQTKGVQYFNHLGLRHYCICFHGSGLERVRIGDRVFFQNEAGMYWLGIIERDYFMFIGDGYFSTVLEGLGYDSDQERVKRLHEDEGWFCDQGELPF